MELSESLKRFRKEFKLKQKDVADVLGVSPQAYQVYESKVTPSARVIIEISNAFGVSSDYLLGLSDNPKRESVNLPIENIDIAALQKKVGKIESALALQGIKI